MTEQDVLRLVEFCVLMQGDGGIIEKSPRYIKEKFAACDGDGARLDAINAELFRFWKQRWQGGAR